MRSVARKGICLRGGLTRRAYSQYVHDSLDGLDARRWVFGSRIPWFMQTEPRSGFAGCLILEFDKIKTLMCQCAQHVDMQRWYFNFYLGLRRPCGAHLADRTPDEIPYS